MTIRKRNILDKIGAKIPGYTGYSDRSDTRKIEKELRSQSARLLEMSEEKIIAYQKTLITRNDLNSVRDWELIRKQINTFISKIRNANYGESSFFSADQIKEEELRQILSFDEQIADKSQVIFNLIEHELQFDLAPTVVSNLLKEVDAILFSRAKFINNYK